MQLSAGTHAHGFTVISREPLPEIDGEAVVALHDVSGAKLLYLANDDNNKAFSIAFRTPPKDDTGVFHILEHSVLCGSRKFPVKEPFVDLLKGSMQTFLNAMTFPDKTMYPVASTNEQDLFNLMDVYLDAVFHPNIYVKRAIFEQEGWHYELHANGELADGRSVSDLPAEETTLIYNGVVYNEMKGSLSDATSVLYDELQKALLPDTPYAYESGGTPRSIPTLTYEDYLDDHRRHYRTDNSYIVLYGNLDIDRALAFLDEDYLVPVHEEQVKAARERAASGLEPLAARPLPLQEPLTAGYSSTTMDTAAENACTACGYVIGNAKDRTRVMAVDILLDALFGSNEAPLKRALLDKGIAHDINAFVADSLQQPFAVVQAHMPGEGVGQKLDGIIAECVEDLLESGLDRQLVEAALSHAEFELREHETGMADGVANAIVAMSGWLYDDGAAVDYLRYEDAFAELKASLEDGYFEKLCTELFLENNHTASVEVIPTPGISDDKTDEKLAALNASLTAGQRKEIVLEEGVLRNLQEAPDSPEAIATLPRLSVKDIGDIEEYPDYVLDEQRPVACLRHGIATHGIVYAYRYYDLGHLSFEDLPYVTVLNLVLGKLDTAQHTAAEIDTLVQGKLGNLTFFSEIYEDCNEFDKLFPKLVASASALPDNIDWLARLPREVVLETDFSDTGRILDILKQRKISMEQTFINAGHSCAAARLRSYYAKAALAREQMGNIGFYRFLCDLIDHYDERAASLPSRLEALAKQVFCDDNCTIAFAGTDADYDRFWQAGPSCDRRSAGGTGLIVPEPKVLNEAFATSSDVCFAATGWNWRLLGKSFTGVWSVVGRALSYDYLWNEVRVKGGAYGVGFTSTRAGDMRFYSYRDPHLDETLDRFSKSCDWLAAFDPSQEDFEGFIVATVATIDAPVKPRQLMRRLTARFFSNRGSNERRIIRGQVIAAKVEEVRALAPVLAEAVDEHALCVFGNRDILQSSKAGLEIIDLIG